MFCISHSSQHPPGWIQSYLLLWGELCPQKIVPMNATLFRNRILVDLTNLR